MAKNKDRSERDQAGVGPEPHTSRQLVPLDDLDGYDFADGEPDIRGWDVVTLNGRELGEVEDVLVDPDRREVVMLEVELRDGGVHAEVPIRAVQLDRNRKVVLLDSGDLDRAVQDQNVTRTDRDRTDVDSDNDRNESERAARADVARNRRSVYADRPPLKRDHDQPSARDDADEQIIERRPVIEEVVVRRRTVDEE